MPLIGWRYKKEIIIDNTGNDNNYENTLVHINLSPDNFDFSKAKLDGSDIRFTDSDGVTSLDYYIEDYDYDSQEATIYVKVPLIPANQTESIYIWYGNTNAVSQSDQSIMNSGFCQYNPDPFNDGSCVAYYPFDGDANDYSGNGHHGTWHGNEQYDKGIFGQCAKFENENHYINAGTSLADNVFNNSNVITFSYWCKFTSEQQYQGRLIKIQNVGDNKHGIWMSRTTIGSGGGASTRHGATINKTIENNKWYHFVAISDGSNGIKIYINGKLEAINTNIMYSITAGENLYINSDPYIKSTIYLDNVRIFNRALTDNEVQTLYNLESNSRPATVTPNETRFSSRLAGTIVDSNGNPITGKNINVYTFADFNQPMIMKTTTTTGNWEFNDFPADPGAEVLVTFESKENNIKLAGASYTTTQES